MRPELPQTILLYRLQQVPPPEAYNIHHCIHRSIELAQFILTRPSGPLPGTRLATVTREVVAAHGVVALAPHVVRVGDRGPVVRVYVVVPEETLVVCGVQDVTG